MNIIFSDVKQTRQNLSTDNTSDRQEVETNILTSLWTQLQVMFNLKTHGIMRGTLVEYLSHRVCETSRRLLDSMMKWAGDRSCFRSGGPAGGKKSNNTRGQCLMSSHNNYAFAMHVPSLRVFNQGRRWWCWGWGGGCNTGAVLALEFFLIKIG